MLFDDTRRYTFPHGIVTLVTPLYEADNALNKTFQTAAPILPPSDLKSRFWLPRKS